MTVKQPAAGTGGDGGQVLVTLAVTLNWTEVAPVNPLPAMVIGPSPPSVDPEIGITDVTVGAAAWATITPVLAIALDTTKKDALPSMSRRYLNPIETLSRRVLPAMVESVI